MHPRRFLPSIALLTAFDAAARHLNFTNAAKELFLTQSAISRQVRSLENQLDKELFIRQGREIILSPAGKAYAQEVQKILAHLRYATQQATNHSKPESLNIALTPNIGTKWLLPRLPEIYEQHPELELNISTHIGELDLAKNDIDAYLTDTERPEDSLNAYPLMNANIIIVMSPALFKL